MSKIQPEARISDGSIGRICLVSVIVFLVAHAALLIGITTPEKFVFDELHYVPAARQMLEPVMPKPLLNPMHPPLAKQIIALSMRAFGDNPLGWRYPGTLFGALAIAADLSLRAGAVQAQEPAIAAALIACFNQMLFVIARTAMLDIFALTFSLFGIAAFLFGFRQVRPHIAFALSGLRLRICGRLQMERDVSARNLHRHHRDDQADAGLARDLRRCRASDWYDPQLWSGFRACHFAICSSAPPAAYLPSFVALHGFSIPDLIEAQRQDIFRQHHDRDCAATPI